MPGGVMVQLPQFRREKIMSVVPSIPIERIDSVAAMYNVEKYYEPQPAAEVRKVVQQLAEKAADLYLAIASLSEEAGDALYHAAYKRGRPNLADETSFVTQMLMGIGRDAALAVEAAPGRPRGALAALISRLSGIMSSHGISPSASAGTELHIILENILLGYGDAVPKNLPKLIGRSLKKAQEPEDTIPLN